MAALRSYLFSIPLIVLLTTFFGIISVIVSFFDAAGTKQAWLAHLWAKTLLKACGVRVHVEGLEHINPAASYIFAVNHASYMDTPVILANITAQFRFLAKSELFKIPLLGTHLASAGHISVPLEDPRAAIKSMQRAGDIIREKKISLLIFPEGGRSETGVLEPFKEGAAYIAIKAGVPIVPMVLVGMHECMPMHSLVVRSMDIKLRILPPIPTESLILRDRGVLTEQLRATILRELTGEVSNGKEADTLQESKLI